MTERIKMPHGVTLIRKKRRLQSNSNSDEEPDNPTHPWPRKDADFGKGIKSPKFTDHYVGDQKKFATKKEGLNRSICLKWDGHDTLFYNAWLHVKIVPPRVVCSHILKSLGIHDEVMACLDTLGLKKFATGSYLTYPDLVRQFMASVRFENNMLSFMAHGQRHFINTIDLGGIYGFDNSVELLQQWPIPFVDAKKMWEKIGHGKWNPKGTKQALIRHPVLRYLHKVLGHTILCRNDTTKVRLQDMCFLYYAIGDRLQGFEGPPAVSFGYVFATHLLSLKLKPFQGEAGVVKGESVGMFLTPLFHYLKINLKGEKNLLRSCNSIDEVYLHQGHTIKDKFHYTFVLPGGTFHIPLPKPSITKIDTNEQLAFFPPREYLIASSTVVASSSNVAPEEDDMLHGVDFNTIEPLIPDSCALAPDPDYGNPVEVVRWLVSEKKKDRTMMGKILHYVSNMGHQSNVHKPSTSRGGRCASQDDEEEEV